MTADEVVADIYPASRWERHTPGPRWFPHTPASSGRRTRSPRHYPGSWRVGPTCSPSLPLHTAIPGAPAGIDSYLAGPRMAGSLLSAIVTSDGAESPAGPQRSEGAAQRLDAVLSAASPAPRRSVLMRLSRCVRHRIRPRAPAPPRRPARSCWPRPPPRCSIPGVPWSRPPGGCAGPAAAAREAGHCARRGSTASAAGGRLSC